MKQEWILRFWVSDSGIVTGQLKADDVNIGLNSADLAAFQQEQQRVLDRFENLRNQLPFEPSATVPDLRADAHQVGAALGRTFIGVTASGQLRRLRSAETRLVLLADDDALHALPWELLILVGDHLPLAAKEGIEWVRRTDQRPGFRLWDAPRPPLRIAFAVSSPEERLGERPEHRLDYENELKLIANAIYSTPISGMQIPLNRRPRLYETVAGSPAAIGGTVLDFHTQVLHLTGHGKGGYLIVEDEDGRPLQLTGEQLFEQTRLSEAADLRLVYLSQCESAKQRTDPHTMRSAAMGLARRLPLVIGLQWPMGVAAATYLAAQFYGLLAQDARDPVTAFCQARRALYQWSQSPQNRASTGAEWATPILFCAPDPPLMLADPQGDTFDPTRGGQVLPQAWHGTLPTGEFVGRRSALRRLLQDLRSGEAAAVVLQGPAGMGKSTLAAQATRILSHRGFYIAVCFGQVTPGRIWSTVLQLVEQACLNDTRLDQVGAPADQIMAKVGALQDRVKDAVPRLAALNELLQDHCNIIVVLDDFEQNQDQNPPHAIGDPELQAALTALCSGTTDERGASGIQLLLTTRYRVPNLAATHLELSPFQPGEWLCLVDRMERRFDCQLPNAQVGQEIYAHFAGLPRLLELFFAVYSGKLESEVKGKARAVRDYLKKLSSPPPGDTTQARKAAYEAQAQDALIADLLQILADKPQGPEAVQWLTRIAAYTLPVVEDGLKVMIPTVDQEAPALRPYQIQQRLDQWTKQAVQLGLLLKGQRRVDKPGQLVEVEAWYQLHPALRPLLEKQYALEPSPMLAGRAAGYYRYRHETGQLYTEQELLAWRAHALASDRPDQAYPPTGIVAGFFEHFGRWGEAIALLEEVVGPEYPETDQKQQVKAALGRLLYHTGRAQEAFAHLEAAEADTAKSKDRSWLRSLICHELASLEKHRGNYDRATELLNESLEIKATLGDRQGVSASLHELAIIETNRGNYDRATELLNESLEIKVALGDRQGTAASLYQLAFVEAKRGNYDRATELLNACLEIDKTLGNRPGIAMSSYMLAQILLIQGRVEPGLKMLDQAQSEFSAAGDAKGEAMVLKARAELNQMVNSDAAEAKKNRDRSKESAGDAFVSQIAGLLNGDARDARIAEENWVSMSEAWGRSQLQQLAQAVPKAGARDRISMMYALCTGLTLQGSQVDQSVIRQTIVDSASELLQSELDPDDMLVLLDGLARAALDLAATDNTWLLDLLRPYRDLLSQFNQSSAIRIIAASL
ncbi:MAG: tetratricopeptide repeat protein [Myxococcota bacterium]|nr:tetratricopeptide repeat protein [Myxococcota bacterium]